MINRAIRSGLAFVIIVFLQVLILTGQNSFINPGFESGQEGDLPVDWDFETENGAQGSVIISRQQAHTGKQSLLVENANGQGYIHPSKIVHLEPGNYIFSAWAKSDRDIDFLMQIYDARIWEENIAKERAQFHGLLSKKCRLKKGKWTKYEMRLKVTEAFPASIQIGLEETAGRLWLDDADVMMIRDDGKKNIRKRNELFLFDTVRNYNEYLKPAEIRDKNGWKKVENKIITGDACIENNRIIWLFRKAYRGAEIYYKIDGDIMKAADIILPGNADDPVKNISSFALMSMSTNKIVLDVKFATISGRLLTAGFFIKNDRVYAEISPGDGVQTIVIRNLSSYIVLPDFLGDDIVLRSSGMAGDELILPDTKFLLRMLDGEKAVMMVHGFDADREIKVRLASLRSGDYSRQYFSDMEIPCKKEDKIWVSVMPEKGIWHETDSDNFNIYRDRELEWAVPFPAAWRLDLQRADADGKGLTDSWWGIFKADDDYKLPKNWDKGPGIDTPATRRSWDPGLGSFIYPFYFEEDRAYLRIPRFSRPQSYSGTMLIYPFDGNDDTPEDISLPMKILKDTLGSGSCDNFLNIEEFKKKPLKDIYPASCEVTEKFEKIFSNREEKKKKDEIISLLEKLDMFVKYMRERIDEYLDWEKEMKEFYKKARQSALQNKGAVDMMENITKSIPLYFEEIKEKIKTPEYEQTLSAKVAGLISSNEVTKAQKIGELARQIRAIGGTQDGALGRFRQAVKMLKQRAGLLYTIETDEGTRNFLRQVRQKADNILEIKYEMEGK